MMLPVPKEVGMSSGQPVYSRRQVNNAIRRAVAEEHKAMLDFIEEFMGSEGTRNFMFSDGYDYALGQMKELLEGRMKR